MSLTLWPSKSFEVQLAQGCWGGEPALSVTRLSPPLVRRFVEHTEGGLTLNHQAPTFGERHGQSPPLQRLMRGLRMHGTAACRAFLDADAAGIWHGLVTTCGTCVFLWSLARFLLNTGFAIAICFMAGHIEPPIFTKIRIVLRLSSVQNKLLRFVGRRFKGVLRGRLRLSVR
jgi:hypothetical protein